MLLWGAYVSEPSARSVARPLCPSWRLPLMKSFRAALLASAILLAGGVASTACAASVTIVDVETGNGDLGNVSVPGYGTPWTTPILMTDSTGKTYVVFCD